MLRKKLSKLIVGIMAAVMLSGGMSGIGQAVFASSNTDIVTSQIRTVVDATTPQEMLTHVQSNGVSVIRVSNASVELTQDIVNAINVRTAQLTIEVGQGGVLTINSAVSLDGTSSKLKIVRGAGKQGAMLEIVNLASNIAVGINGVTFDNSGVNLPAFINKAGAGVSATLTGNTLLNDGDLAYNTGSNDYRDNKLGTGSLTDNQNIILNINGVAGATTITMGGTTSDYNLIEAPQRGLVTLTVRDANGTFVSEYDVPVDGSGNFSGEVISGLRPGQTYSVTGSAIYTDGKGNTYTRTTAAVQFTTTAFISTVTNITNNSATVNINHGGLQNSVPNKYPLTITVTGGTATINPTSIDANTNSVSLTGLASGTSYTYEIKSGTTVIDRGTFRTTSSTISGGGSTGGGSVVSGDLTTNDINRADIKDVSASIPVGNTTLANSLRDGRDYKTNVEGVGVTYSNGRVELTGLVPEKDYRDLTITYTDKDGRTRTVRVPAFKTKVSETKLRQFIVDVYRYSLDRIADERGFAYWEDQLKNKKTSPDEFVKNLLNEGEFVNKHTTTTAKIEALYQVIVNRASDSQGLSFWTRKYDDLVARGYSDSMALRSIVDEMVNEQEFRNRVRDLGL